MPQLRIRDVKEKLEKDNESLTQELKKIRNAMYVLAVVQLGLVSHLFFSILSK